MNMIKKVCMVVILSCILLNLVSCNSENQSWIAEYNNEKVAVGMYIQYLIEEYRKLYIKNLTGELVDSNQKDKKSDKNKEETSDKNGETKKVSLLKKFIDGKTGSRWIIDNAKDEIANNIAINHKFEDMKLELDKEKVDYLDHNLSKQWETLNEQQKYEKRGVSKESVLQNVILQLKRNAIFDAYYSETGLHAVTNQQLKEYLKDEYNKVKYFSFELYGLDDKEKEKKKHLYQEFLTRAKSGENIDVLIKEFDNKEYDYDESKESKVDDSDDNMSSENERYDIEQSEMEESGYNRSTDDVDETVAIYKKDTGGEFTTDVKEAIEKANIDEVTGFEGKDELIIFIKKDPYDSDNYIEENRNNLLSEMKQEEFEKEIKTWINLDSVHYNQKAINKYSPEKLKLDK